MDFSVYDHATSSEDSGESSRAKNHNSDAMKTLRINSPVSFKQSHPSQIYKSKSGHSFKGFEL